MQVWSLDKRSLALFRVSLSCSILADVVLRMGDLEAHYTDDGIFPRALNLSHLNSYSFSLMFISGTSFFALLFFLFTIVCTLALLVGYRTWLANFLVWACINSIHVRSIVVSNYGDNMLRLLLFWSLFLPLGSYFSIDKMRQDIVLHRQRDNTLHDHNHDSIETGAASSPVVNGFHTFCFVIQLAMVYWFTALLKSDPEWHAEGSALYYALNIDYYTTPIGKLLLLLPPSLLSMLTRSALIFEYLGPCLFLSPFWTANLRILSVVLFCIMHLTFSLCFTLGIFSFFFISAFLALLPPTFWNYVDAMCRRRRLLGKDIRIVYQHGAKALWSIDVEVVVYCLKTFLLLPHANIDCSSDQELPPITVTVDLQPTPSPYRSLFMSSPFTFWCFRPQHPMSTSSINNESAIDSTLNISESQEKSSVLRRKVHQRESDSQVSSAPANLEVINNVPTESPSTKKRPFKSVSRLLRNSLLVCCLVFVVNCNIQSASSIRDPLQSVPFLYPISYIGSGLNLVQEWGMFSPGPPRDDGWFIVRGSKVNSTLKDVDLFRQYREGRSELTWDKPSCGRCAMQNPRWLAVWVNVWTIVSSRNEPLYPLVNGLASFFCRSSNRLATVYQQQIQNVTVTFMREHTEPNYKPLKIERFDLWVARCGLRKESDFQNNNDDQ